MSENFILSCESTVDMPYSLINGRNIPVLFYNYNVDGTDYVDDMGKDPDTLKRFYGFIAQGKLPSTSQINTFTYLDFFEGLLQKGDVLHIAFGSGMTPSVNNAVEAAEQLKEKYPDRKIIVIDSTCSSSGYGMLVEYATDMRDAGKSMDEIAQWVTAHAHKIHHQFFSTDLKYFRRSGRMSGAAATVAAVLDICPLMHLNYDGKIIAYGKVRGKKNAIRETVKVMAQRAVGGKEYSGKCFICNSNVLSDAEALKAEILATFPNVKSVEIYDIGTIIASHSGPGTVAVFFLGDERDA